MRACRNRVSRALRRDAEPATRQERARSAWSRRESTSRLLSKWRYLAGGCASFELGRMAFFREPLGGNWVRATLVGFLGMGVPVRRLRVVVSLQAARADDAPEAPVKSTKGLPFVLGAVNLQVKALLSYRYDR